MAEDELTELRAENIRLRNELDRQVNAWGGYVDAHAGNYSRMNARITELEATVVRLEADNRRLRHLDAMPVDAMERYHLFTHYEVHAANDAGYTTQQFDSDDEEIRLWLTSRDGAA